MLTDRQLIDQIQIGQGEALGQLFDRYGGNVFDFLARVVGEPDEAVELVIDVFSRLPKALVGTPELESIHGALFSLAHETALSYLRRRGWLDALPRQSPLDAAASDLANDIWQSARAMPGAQRAVLAIVEHQALSPTDQAAALGLAQYALPDVVDQARRAFDELYDLHARAEGKPTFASVDAEKVPGLLRRSPDLHASLFTFLPTVFLLPAAQARVRSQIVAAVGQPASVAAALPRTVPALEPLREPTETSFLIPMLAGLLLVVALLAAILVFVAVNGNPQTAVADTTPPVIKQLTPQDGAILSSEKHVVVQAIYGDDQGVDTKSVRMLLDNHDVTTQSTVSDTSVSFAGDLGAGQHVALVELKDAAANKTSQTWIFTISAATPSSTPPFTLTPLLTATAGPTSTPVPTLTRAPTPTALPTATSTLVPPQPDMVVTDISLSPTGQIIYVIRNSGVGDVAQPFLVQVLVDNGGVDSNRKVSSLGAGQEISLFVPNYTLAGTHAVTVRVNSDLAVQESNNRNNELVRTLSGPTPTPSPTLTPSPSATPH